MFDLAPWWSNPWQNLNKIALSLSLDLAASCKKHGDNALFMQLCTFIPNWEVSWRNFADLRPRMGKLHWGSARALSPLTNSRCPLWRYTNEPVEASGALKSTSYSLVPCLVYASMSKTHTKLFRLELWLEQCNTALQCALWDGNFSNFMHFWLMSTQWKCKHLRKVSTNAKMSAQPSQAPSLPCTPCSPLSPLCICIFCLWLRTIAAASAAAGGLSAWRPDFFFNCEQNLNKCLN